MYPYDSAVVRHERFANFEPICDLVTLVSVAFLVSSVISFAIQIKRIELKAIAGWSREEKGDQEWYGGRTHGWFGEERLCVKIKV